MLHSSVYSWCLRRKAHVTNKNSDSHHWSSIRNMTRFLLYPNAHISLLCRSSTPTPNPPPRKIFAKGPIKHGQERLAFNNLAYLMASEEKLRDGILTEAKCRHSLKKWDTTTSGQYRLEVGLTQGTGTAVQSGTVRVPARPLCCGCITGARGLAASSLTVLQG